jgi:hypothetical protein
LNDFDGKWAELAQLFGTTAECSSSAHLRHWFFPVFAIFDEESSSEVAVAIDSITAIERISAAQFYRDILHFFDPVMRPDGTLIGSVDLMLNHLLAIHRLYPELVDRAKPYTNYILIETLLQMLMRLPHSSLLNSSIYRILLELCKKDGAIASVVASAASILFQFVNDLDAFCVKELANWLSFHLLNTRMAWPYWSFFVDEFNAATFNSPTRTFVALLIDKCGRAAVQESITKAVPEEFHWLLPQDANPRCHYLAEGSLVHPDNVAGAEDVDQAGTPKPKDDGEPAAVDAESASQLKSSMTVTEGLNATSVMETLLSMIESKADSEAVETWMDSIDEDGVDMTMLGSLWKVKALVQVIFSVGKTTLSSMASLFERYLDLFRTVAESDEEQLVRRFARFCTAFYEWHLQEFLESVVEVVGHETGMLSSAVDILLRRSILGPHTVASWLTKPEQLARLGSIGNSVNSTGNALHSAEGKDRINANVALLSVAEVLTDRCVDLVNASVAYRRGLIRANEPVTHWSGCDATGLGSQLAIQSTTVVSGDASSGHHHPEDDDEVTIGKKSRRGGEDEDHDSDAEGGRGRGRGGDDRDGNDDSRSKRRKRTEQDDVSSDTKAVDDEQSLDLGHGDSANAANDDEGEPIINRGEAREIAIGIANETVSNSLHTVCRVYVTLLRACLSAMSNLDNDPRFLALIQANVTSSTPSSDGGADITPEDARYGWELASVGIALRLARSFHSTERQLNLVQSVVVFCDVREIQECIADLEGGRLPVMAHYLINCWKAVAKPNFLSKGDSGK